MRTVITIFLALTIVASASAQRLTYDALVRSAKIYLQEAPKDYVKAEEKLRQAIDEFQDKQPVEAYFGLGALQAEKKRYAEMNENFEAALKICAEATDKKLKKRCDKENISETIISIRLSSWIDEFNSGASVLAGAVDLWPDLEDAESEDDTLDILDEIDATYRSALQNFVNASIIIPDSAQAWINAGITYYNLGKVKKTLGEPDAETALKDSAIIAYETAIEVHPENFDLLSNMSTIYFELKNWDACAATFGKMAALQPDNVSVLSNLSMLLMELDSKDTLNTLNLGDSITFVFDRIIELDPTNVDALSQRAFATITESIGINDSISVLRGLDENVHKSEIQALTEVRNAAYRSVIDDFTVVAETDPGNYDAWYWMGNCYYFLEEYQKSLECYEKALAIKPDAKEVLEILAPLYLKQGDRKKSDEAQKKYEELVGESG
ncbi:MAG: tetratricopeptide repeat protein [candidate division Zixibacteria bacterium]|nr:tetratricopeptide repeat protein [candidate division Zixibacteria bacterium]MBU1469207.1 tetratricopeptide repeat protein [candidate division Zixibacteria bacterium]MBU2626555.1 tetratricopeptide repeat protein [candidate division Zixibacteria bacterium]